MVKISVILPIYNVEFYLEETLNCLLDQTIVDDIEVLMIDDGSTDDSRYIIEKYALDYDNFHAFHKKNEGQGIARNFALNFANGEYIHFLDSDDYIPSNAYETLYALALENKSDIIIGDVLRFGNYNLWSDSLFKHSFEGIPEDIKNTNLNHRPSLLWDTSTSNKLYKRKFLIDNNIKFPNKKIFFEDLVFSMESYIKAKSIYISKFIFYYWRYRGKKTSVTQQHQDIRNFYDRIEILNLIDELMKQNNLSDDLRFFEYKKWLNHDLKIFLKKLIFYPENLCYELINEVNKILNLIPDEFLLELNSFKQILYNMIKNNDVESLLSFAHLEKDFMEFNYDYSSLDKKYVRLINFKQDSLEEELNASLLEVNVCENQLRIQYDEKINYVPLNFPHSSCVFLVDENNNEIPLKIIENTIILPLDLIEDKNHLKLKVQYKSKDFVKESFLLNKKRRLIKLKDYFIDFQVGVNNLLYLDILKENHAEIEIRNIKFDGDFLIFKGNSRINKLDEATIKNIVSFELNTYNVFKYGDEFRIIIPYKDILNVPIKKWELDFKQYSNCILPFEEFNFYYNKYNIHISSIRNKILIENNLYNSAEQLSNIKNRIGDIKLENRNLVKSNKKLYRVNKRLIKSNEKLDDEISEFKSRRAVKIVDSIKKIR